MCNIVCYVVCVVCNGVTDVVCECVMDVGYVFLAFVFRWMD